MRWILLTATVLILLASTVLAQAVNPLIASATSPPALSERFNANDPSTWDLTNPSDIKSIDVEQWKAGKVDQSKITGENVASIPVDYFDPTKVGAEHLAHASTDQIKVKLDKFTNLKKTDPAKLKEAIDSKFNADVDLAEASEAKFANGVLLVTGVDSTGKLGSTEFNPKEYPRDKVTVIAEKDGTLRFVAKQAASEGTISKSGSSVSQPAETTGSSAELVPPDEANTATSAPLAETRIKGGLVHLDSTDGSFRLKQRTVGEVVSFSGRGSGTLTLHDGTEVKFQTKEGISVGKDSTVTWSKAQGTIGKTGFRGSGEMRGTDVFVKEGTYLNQQQGIAVTATNGPVYVGYEGHPIPTDWKDAAATVLYSTKNLYVRGPVDVQRGEIHVFPQPGTDKTSYFESVNGKTRSGGIIAFEDDTTLYTGLTKQTTYERTYGANGREATSIKADGAPDGDVARFERKIAVGRLEEEAVTDVSLRTRISKQGNQYELNMDRASQHALAEVVSKGQVAFSERDLDLSLGDGKSSFTLVRDTGAKYKGPTGYTLDILPAEKVQAYLGSRYAKESLAVRQLDDQIFDAAQKGLSTDSLVRARDAFVLSTSMQKGTRSIADNIRQGEEFISLHPSSPMKATAQLGLAEAYSESSAMTPRTSGIDGERILGETSKSVTPLHYRTRVINGEEKVIAWSPDGKDWRGLHEMQTSDGRSPTNDNVALIKKLQENNGAMIVLNTESTLRQKPLEGAKATESMGLASSQQDLMRASMLAEAAKADPDIKIVATLTKAAIEEQAGHPGKAYVEYGQLIARGVPDSVQSKAYTGMAMTSLDAGHSPRDALFALQKASTLDPANTHAKELATKLENSILRSISSGLSSTNDQLDRDFDQKLGLERDAGIGGTWGRTKQMFTQGLSKSLVAIDTTYYADLANIKNDETRKIMMQKDGTNTISHLRERGYSFDEIRAMSTDRTGKRIMNALDIPKTGVHAAGFIRENLAEAFANPDVQLVMAWNKGTANAGEQFVFETGNGYATAKTAELLKHNWRDSALDVLSAKNVFLTLAPSATVYGTSLAGWGLRGIGAGGTAILGPGGTAAFSKFGGEAAARAAVLFGEGGQLGTFGSAARALVAKDLLITSQYSPFALRALDGFVQTGARVGGDIVVGYGAYEAGKAVAGEAGGYLAAGLIGELRPWTKALDAVEMAGRRGVALVSTSGLPEIDRFLERGQQLQRGGITSVDAEKLIERINKVGASNSYSTTQSVVARTPGIKTSDAFVVGKVPPVTDEVARAKYLSDPNNWAPERRSLQEVLAQQMERDARALSDALGDATPTIYVQRGNTAAGKTTALKTDPRFETLNVDGGALNVDTIKGRLIAADRLGGQAITGAPGVHEEGGIILEQVKERLLKSGVRSIVLDSRFGDPKDIREVLATAKKGGYDVIIRDIDADLGLSAPRVLTRTPGRADPLVPFDPVAKGFVQNRMNRDEVLRDIAGEQRVRYELYSALPGQKPVLVGFKPMDKTTLQQLNPSGINSLLGETTSVRAAGVQQRVIDVAGTKLTDDYIRSVVDATTPAFKAHQEAVLRYYQTKGYTVKQAMDTHSTLLNPPPGGPWK